MYEETGVYITTGASFHAPGTAHEIILYASHLHRAGDIRPRKRVLYRISFLTTAHLCAKICAITHMSCKCTL
jgi:hypothetical protein